MKYLLVLAIVWVAFVLWRSGRQREAARQAPPPSARQRVGAPQAMARCAHCGLHLPAADALPGKDGKVYCSAAHRQADA